MTSLFCPRDHYCENSKINYRVMSARFSKVKTKIELHENSFDGSQETEFIDLIKDDGSYGSGEENSPLPQAYLESNANNSSLDISNSVTYKLIPLAASQATGPNMQNSSSHDTYFVSIANPVEVFATNTPTKKVTQPKRPTRTPVASHQSKKAAVIAKKRDDKRRATHNEVERRRRDKINTWIMKLAALVPNSGMPDSVSKGGILAKACDHISELNEKQKRLDKLEDENEKLILEVMRLNQELSDLRKGNASKRNLADNCILLTNRPKEEKC